MSSIRRKLLPISPVSNLTEESRTSFLYNLAFVFVLGRGGKKKCVGQVRHSKLCLLVLWYHQLCTDTFQGCFQDYFGVVFCFLQIVTHLESLFKWKWDPFVLISALVCYTPNMLICAPLQSNACLRVADRVSGTKIMGYLSYSPLLCTLSFRLYLNIRVPVDVANSLVIRTNVSYLFLLLIIAK